MQDYLLSQSGWFAFNRSEALTMLSLDKTLVFLLVTPNIYKSLTMESRRGSPVTTGPTLGSIETPAVCLLPGSIVFISRLAFQIYSYTFLGIHPYES